MPVLGQGWEFHIVRQSEQRRASDGHRRTVGTYAIYQDGKKQPGLRLSGAVAETRGPGANRPNGNGRRLEAGRYPLWTQAGTNYVTYGYNASESRTAKPKPGIELMETGERTEILIHPGYGFLSSVGCINPCTSLPTAEEMIDYVASRRRVLAIIDNIRVYLGTSFPMANGQNIPRAFVVIDGEPTFAGS